MSLLLIDCETYSELDVTKVGSYEYACHASTFVLLWSLRDPRWKGSLVSEEPSLWKILNRLKKSKRITWNRNESLDLIHWTAFDRHIVEHAQTLNSVNDTWNYDPTEDNAILGPNNTRWCDLSDMSLIHGGPIGLNNAAKFWAGAEKGSEGKGLISLFCGPQENGLRITKKDDPVRWERFRSYAAQDTDVMVPILTRFIGLDSLGGEVFDDHWLWIRLVNRMNERGVPIDRRSAVKAERLLSEVSNQMNARCQKIYGFKPTMVAKVRDYLGTPNCTKETLEEYIDGKMGNKKQIRLAEIRLVTSGAAAKKLLPMLKHSQTDGRVRGCFIYHGARTRRLTSVEVQFHNMLRQSSQEAFFKRLNSKEKPDTKLLLKEIRTNIRGFIQAPKGRVLVSADFSQIELRIGAGIAGESWLLEAFEKGLDPYLTMASSIYRTPVTDKSDPRRQFGKIVELASLFGLGRFGLIKNAAKNGIQLTEAAAQRVIDTYRKLHPEIVKTWAAFEKAFIRCIHNKPGFSIDVDPIVFERTDLAIKLIRPSGFAQYYWLPRMVEGEWPDGGERMEIQYTSRNKGGVMSTGHTYGGDLFQSGVQGTAADILLHAMQNCEQAGYPPIMSVHDEVVCEIDDDGENHIERLCDAICKPPDWAKGLLLVAEGWQQRRFTK